MAPKHRLYTEIYALRHPVTGEVRYIGKANDSQRRLASHLRDARRRRTPLYDWMNTLDAPPIVEVVFRVSEEIWPSIERRCIAVARRMGARLLNVAEGGEQPFCSPEQRAENARRVTVLRTSTPERAKSYYAKRAIGSARARAAAAKA